MLQGDLAAGAHRLGGSGLDPGARPAPERGTSLSTTIDATLEVSTRRSTPRRAPLGLTYGHADLDDATTRSTDVPVVRIEPRKTSRRALCRCGTARSGLRRLERLPLRRARSRPATARSGPDAPFQRISAGVKREPGTPLYREARPRPLLSSTIPDGSRRRATGPLRASVVALLLEATVVIHSGRSLPQRRVRALSAPPPRAGIPRVRAMWASPAQESAEPRAASRSADDALAGSVPGAEKRSPRNDLAASRGRPTRSGAGDGDRASRAARRGRRRRVRGRRRGPRGSRGSGGWPGPRRRRASRLGRVRGSAQRLRPVPRHLPARQRAARSLPGALEHRRGPGLDLDGRREGARGPPNVVVPRGRAHAA